MSDNPVSEAMSDQFRRAIGMFRQAVRAFPAEEWRRGDLAYLRPAGVAYHVVETIDFYAGEVPADQFPWGGRFAVDWEGGDAQRLPSQDQVLAYLEEAERKLAHWLAGTDLLAPEKVFPWTGPNALGRAVYLLRNTQHHLAEMALELTRRDCQAPEWQ